MKPEERGGEQNLDLMCMQMYGITWDFFNEVPTEPDSDSSIDFFINKCKQGWAKTYTQRFQNDQRILTESDSKKVEELDRLMSEAIEAAKKDDRETVKSTIKQILLYRK